MTWCGQLPREKKSLLDGGSHRQPTPPESQALQMTIKKFAGCRGCFELWAFRAAAGPVVNPATLRYAKKSRTKTNSLRRQETCTTQSSRPATLPPQLGPLILRLDCGPFKSLNILIDGTHLATQLRYIDGWTYHHVG